MQRPRGLLRIKARSGISFTNINSVNFFREKISKKKRMEKERKRRSLLHKICITESLKDNRCA